MAAIPTNLIHPAKPGVNPKPKHLADGYEHAVDGRALCCRVCGERIGYGKYEAQIEDCSERGLVYTVIHEACV